MTTKKRKNKIKPIGDLMSNMQNYFKEYFSKIETGLECIDHLRLDKLVGLIEKTKETGNKIIIVGNGGSASIASHLMVDFTNAAKIRAINFNEPGIITCLSNDYGYENWISKALDFYANPGDTVILISSSGQSKNMLIGANKAKSININIVTFSGFLEDNPLRTLGDINFWVDSKAYNVVEMVHNIWLLAIVDYLADKNNGVLS
jgi:D-sedoheptulose 7-phosphate isomerase